MFEGDRVFVSDGSGELEREGERRAVVSGDRVLSLCKLRDFQYGYKNLIKTKVPVRLATGRYRNTALYLVR